MKSWGEVRAKILRGKSRIWSFNKKLMFYDGLKMWQSSNFHFFVFLTNSSRGSIKIILLSFHKSHYLTNSHTNVWKNREFEVKSINKKLRFYDGLKMRLFWESVSFWEVQKWPKTFHFWESAIYLAIWPFSDFKKMKRLRHILSFWQSLG